MKTMKKVIALLLVAVMAIGLMATTAFAANDGKITVRNATIGETYAVYKVFDLTYSGENVAYTYTKTGADDALFDALNAAGSPFTLTQSAGNANLYSVTTTTEDASAISTWLKANATLLGTADATQTAASAEVKFTGLPYGYYYVTSSLGAVVTIDSTLNEVTVVDKNQGPTWDNNPEDPDDPTPHGGQANPGKVIVNADGTRVTANSANYGDTVRFNISVNATAYVGEELVTYYYIADKLANGFGNVNDIVVRVYPIGDDGKYDTDNVQTLIKDTDYTLKKDGKIFQINVPFGEKYGAQAKIEVTYNAVVNADGTNVVIGGDGNLNQANFAYDTDDNFDPDHPGYDPEKPGDPTNPGYPEDPYRNDDPFDPTHPVDPENPENPDHPNPFNKDNVKETVTYVYALAVQKVDPTGHKLSGAEFKIDGIRAVEESKGVYKYTGTGEATNLSTDDNGMLIVKGLAAGTYNVAETKAPSGYNILSEAQPIEVTQTAKYTTTEIATYYYNEDGEIVNAAVAGGTSVTYETTDLPVFGVVIVNQAGTELPSTGGMGTTILYIVGGMLVVAAGVLLITKKRMGHEA